MVLCRSGSLRAQCAGLAVLLGGSLLEKLGRSFGRKLSFTENSRGVGAVPIHTRTELMIGEPHVFEIEAETQTVDTTPLARECGRDNRW